MTVSAAVPTTRRGVLRHLTGERGAAGPVTAVIVVPTILLFIAMSIQAGLWYIARTAALTSAEEGARAMAGQQATQDDGCSVARSFAQRAAYGLFTVDSITCTRGTDSTVVVTGHSMSLVPGLPFTVRQSATLPVEKVS